MFRYRKLPKWKYRTLEDYKCYVGIMFGNNIDHPYVKISNGYMVIKEGYAWDGATWFPDIKSIMRGSLAHDALYQMMRERIIGNDKRKCADSLLRMFCYEDGMYSILCKCVYLGVRLFASYASK
jgi:hypothetical protein